MDTTSSAVGASRADRVSWDRKRRAIERTVAQLNGIESSILELMGQKDVIVEEINAMRREMVVECIHPSDLVVEGPDGTRICKFCERRFVLRSVE